ncbi:MAG: DNA polymerase III subunit delta' [Caulobacteraceae bacterium]
MIELRRPRETYDLQGAQGPEQAFLDALGRGRMHHAWLLTGPQGVGKATFAYRAARRLLGARPDPGRGLLGADPLDPVSRMIEQRAHPDLLILERDNPDVKPRKGIPVDEARRLPEFFSKAPSMAGYRVAIIDAADHLAGPAANALLKSLEEPPERGVLFLVAHAPGRLLPTIRSRCRRLAFHPWTEEATAAFVEAAGLAPEDARRLAAMSHGSPGEALSLAASGALEADKEARDILRNLPRTDDAALQALADTFRSREGQPRFELIMDRLADQIRAMAVETAGQGDLDGLDRWAEAWERLSRLPGEAEAINLDRQDAFWTSIGRLKRAARA